MKNQPSFMQQIEKIVVNTSFGRLTTQSGFEEKVLPELVKEMSMMTGQKPQARPLRQSIAGFKVRKGQVIGLKVTLRGRRMAQFLHKVVAVVLPRIRDFRGISLTAVDKGGNVNIGIKEQFVFPEISPDVSKVNFGVQITVVPKSSVGSRDEAVNLFRQLGIPLKKQ